MHEPELIDRSWGWLIVLLGVSALLMTMWFVIYPIAALVCTLAGISICLLVLTQSGASSGASDHQTERRET